MKSEYTIPFVGLKLGVHEFLFSIENEFFEAFDYSEIEKGKIHVKFLLEKKETMMIGTFFIQGEVEVTCDRCTDLMNAPVEGEYRLVYKFASEESDDENLVIVYPEEFEINIKDSIHEFILVSLPTRIVHSEGECNEEMMSYLDEYIIKPEEDFDESEEDISEDLTDPRWEALKNLKNK